MNVVRQAGKVRLLVLGGALVALVSLMAWGQAAGQPAHAEETGVRMAFNANGLGVTCDAPSEPTECTVPLGGFFTLQVEAIEPPEGGYIGIQTFINYDTYDPDAAEDRLTPGTCSDGEDNFEHDGADIRDTLPAPLGNCAGDGLTYQAAGTPGEEIVWPDLASADIALRARAGAGLVLHGGLTGLTPPLPMSTYVGSVLDLVMTCTSTESTSEVELLPYGDPLADTNGTGFAIEIGGAPHVPSKPDTLTITCEEVVVEEPTPTPTVGPEATATPAAQVLPPTGTGVVGDLGGEDGVNGASGVNGDNGGLNAGLWAAIGVLLAAAALALAFFGWRYASRRQAG